MGFIFVFNHPNLHFNRQFGTPQVGELHCRELALARELLHEVDLRDRELKEIPRAKEAQTVLPRLLSLSV